MRLGTGKKWTYFVLIRMGYDKRADFYNMTDYISLPTSL